MTAEPHPQRCETCNSYERGSQWCSVLKERICHLEYTLIERVGCASHSTAKSEQDYQDDDCIWMTPEEEEKRIRNHEREKVLDEVISLINKNCFELEGKRLKITPLLLMQEIDGLRKGEQR